MTPFPDADSFNTYGGHIVNAAPVEDPTTDRDALMVNAALVSVAAMTRTGTKAWVRFVGAASAPTVATRNQGWPTSVTAPTISRTGPGDFTVTWPTTVTDEDGNIHTLAFNGARWSIDGTSWALATVTVTANTVRIRLANLVGGVATANDFVGSTITVEAF